MRVLFVCVGNTCRSQMAEGWAKHLGIDSASAGTNKSGVWCAMSQHPTRW